MRDIATLIGNEDEFPVLRHWDFFNHAGVSPLTHSAAEAIRQYSHQAETGVYLGTQWYADVERLRQLCAKFINAHRDEIAFIKNTSEGISIVANGIDWSPGDVIVTANVEYPANVYPWMQLERTRGVKLVMIPEETGDDGAQRVPIEPILLAASDPKCRMVTLSSVQYASGQRMDIARVGEFCRANGKLFCVDAIQSVGVLPIDVRAMNIDYLSADSHKWMMGPEGAGFLFVRKELIERTTPTSIGWLSVINPQNYGDYNLTFKPDAGRYECGTYNIPGLLAMKASLELLHSVGVEAISARLKFLGDLATTALADAGFRIVSPRGENEWSGSVAFVSQNWDHNEIVRTLRRDHKIEVAAREKRLRISPHLYNTQPQMHRLFDKIGGLA